MNIKHELYEQGKAESFKVIAWHEDSTQTGNYVLTLQTATGRTVTGIERNDLTTEQVRTLIETVNKDDTGI